MAMLCVEAKHDAIGSRSRIVQIGGNCSCSNWLRFGRSTGSDPGSIASSPYGSRDLTNGSIVFAHIEVNEACTSYYQKYKDDKNSCFASRKASLGSSN